MAAVAAVAASGSVKRDCHCPFSTSADEFARICSITLGTAKARAEGNAARMVPSPSQ
jgi:predicted ArsR family transcriptional regulator